MSRPYTRTVLFSETFDFPTPPTWDRQSIIEARRSIRASLSRDSLKAADSWRAVQNAAAEHSRPCSPVRIRPAASPTPTTPFHLDEKPLPVYPLSPRRSNIAREEPLAEEDEEEDDEHWSPRCHQSHQHEPQQQQPQQELQGQQQWPWRHPHASLPDCPCCSTNFMSRWSICTDDSRPPSPSSSIHKRLRKMASSTTLRSVRSSILLRVKTSLLQISGRGSH